MTATNKSQKMDHTLTEMEDVKSIIDDLIFHFTKFPEETERLKEELRAVEENLSKNSIMELLRNLR